MVARRPRTESASSRSLKHRAPLLIAFALAAIAAIAAFGFDRRPGEMRDFEVYWTAASRALDGERLYRSEDGHFQFKYLPAFAVLTSPVALVPLGVAKSIWFTVSAAMLALLVSLSLQILPERRRPAWALVLVVVVAMGKFYGHELVLGQVNILFGVIATAGILMIRRGHDVAAAVLFVSAVAVKPYAILFLPWIALVRGRTALIAGVTGVLVLVAVPVPLYGLAGSLDLHREWWATVTASTAPNLTNNDNVSIAGMFAKWFGAGRPASIAAILASGAVLILVPWIVFRRTAVKHPEALEGALLLMIIPLLSPQGWDYVFLVGTPAIAMVANYDDRLPPLLRWTAWIAILTIGLSLFDLMGRERYAAFMSWSVITVCFLVLVAALAALRRRSVA